MERITVGLLAKELGLKPNDIFRLARDEKLNLTRVAATMPRKHADQIRARHATELKAAEQRTTRRITAPWPPPSAKLAPTKEEPVPGPSNACSCCGIAIRIDPTAAVTRCRACGSHYAIEGEDDARVLARLRDHESALLHAYRVEAEEAADFEQRMKGALRSRDSWRGALVETMLAHEQVAAGGCRCGSREFPCFTVNKLEAVNRGITRQVETFGAMTDKDRDAALYRRDHWDSSDREDPEG